MIKSAGDALFWYLQGKDVIPPGGRMLFAGARPAGGLAAAARHGAWVFTQDLKAPADDLAAAGYRVDRDIDGTAPYDAALLLTPRQDDAAKGMLAQAALALRADGWLIAAAPSDAGGRRLAGDFTALGLTGDTAAKHHARIVAARKGEAFAAIMAQAWVEAAAYRVVAATGLVSRPGLFAWDRLDAGSALLLACLPDTLKGKGGDYGCGHGALAHAVLTRHGTVKALLCLDADAGAIEACRRNLAAFAERADCRWADLTRDMLPKETLDFVVMNPPFHDGGQADAGLGLACIAAARRSLRRGGRLYLVANSHLPYETKLGDLFHTTERLAERDGYKVFALTA